MKRTIMIVPVILVFLLGISCPEASPDVETSEEQMLRAAIFVRNRAGEDYAAEAAILGDMIASRLTGKGFSVIDKDNVAEKFEKSRVDAFTDIMDKLTGGEADDAGEILKDASVLRMAQMIGADYVIVSTLDSIGHTTKKFQGKETAYGVDNEVTDYIMRISLEVLEAARGGSVYGDVVRVSRRIAQSDTLKIETSDIVDSLLDEGSREIAENIAGEVDRIRTARVRPPDAVPFTVSVGGIEGATITLDGAAIGSSGEGPVELAASPGIHIMRVTRQWFIPWEKPVNIHSGQDLNISLKLSDEGIARFQDLEGFKTAMAIAREKEDTSELAEYEIAEGEKKKREESYERWDTSNVEHHLSIGDNTPRVIIEEEE